jgi:hypothetical protein
MPDDRRPVTVSLAYQLLPTPDQCIARPTNRVAACLLLPNEESLLREDNLSGKRPC